MITELSSSNDTAFLKQIIQQQHSQIEQLVTQVAALSTQLEKLQHLFFGQKSERRTKATTKTPAGETADVTVSNQTPGTKQSNKIKNGRRRLPKELERFPIHYDLPADKQHCQNCHSALHCIGQDTYEQLEFLPAKLYVKQHIRSKYACRCCKGQIVSAPMPEMPVDKGLAGSGLLAEILINKYQDALPLYRQEQRWQRLGYDIPRSTLCDWVDQCADRLKPIVEAMTTDALLRSAKLHTDDTTVPVLAKGKTHTGRLWVYVGGAKAPPCVIYRYSPTRSKDVPQSFLKDYQGYLQADAYAGYDGLYADKLIIEVACLAHARRKFVDAAKLVTETTLADGAIDFIGQLYAIEIHAKPLNDEQRYYLRRREAKPILKRFYRWLKQYQTKAPPKSPLGQAINYTLNHWRALNNYLRDGMLDIDNNRAERAIKPLVIGRKNYLFAGSHKGAENAAVIYSLIESCKACKKNPYDYIKDVLDRLPTTTMKNISELFVYNWQPKLQ
jgi:transposase